MKAVVIAILVGWIGVAAPLSFNWEGDLRWELPLDVSFESTISLGWEIGGWTCGLSSTHTGAGWERLSFTGGSGETKAELSFDPSVPSFSSAKLTSEGELPGGYKWKWLGVLEPGKFGFGLKIFGSYVLREVGLRFNLKRFRDEPIGEELTLSYGYLSARFPFCCVSPVWVRADWEKEGFEKLSCSFMLPQGIFGEGCPLYLGASLGLSEDKKEERVFPGIYLSTPRGLFVFLSADWDEDLHLLKGLRLYGFLFRWKSQSISLNLITSLAEDVIDLVEDPYWEMLGICWNLNGCCGPGKVSVELFFGDGGLMGLGKLKLKGEVNLSRSTAFSLELSLPKGDPPTISAGWNYLIP